MEEKQLGDERSLVGDAIVVFHKHCDFLTSSLGVLSTVTQFHHPVLSQGRFAFATKLRIEY